MARRPAAKPAPPKDPAEETADPLPGEEIEAAAVVPEEDDPNVPEIPLLEGRLAPSVRRNARYLELFRVEPDEEGRLVRKMLFWEGKKLFSPQTSHEFLAQKFDGGRFYVQVRDAANRITGGGEVPIENRKPAPPRPLDALPGAPVHPVAPGVFAFGGMDPNFQAMMTMMQQAQAQQTAMMAKLTEGIQLHAQQNEARVREDSERILDANLKIAQAYTGSKAADDGGVQRELIDQLRTQIREQAREIRDLHSELMAERRERAKVERERDRALMDAERVQAKPGTLGTVQAVGTVLENVIERAAPILAHVLQPHLGPAAGPVAQVAAQALSGLAAPGAPDVEPIAPPLNGAGHPS